MSDFLGLGGQNALILGVANHRSIAWGVAQRLAEQGMRLVLTYQERVERHVRELAEKLPEGTLVLPCDVTRDDDLDTLFDRVRDEVGTLHGLVHSVAFADRRDLSGGFIDTSRDGFHKAMDISAFSLTALARRAAPLMTEGGGIVAMTFAGAVRVFPGYNVMGVAKAALEAEIRYLANDLGPSDVRVNGISAGPIKTLSARGVSSLSNLLHASEESAPLRRTVDPADVADSTAFLLSARSRNVTGQVLYVDAGYNIMGY